MAAKRLLEDPDNISEGKRVRHLPSFTVVIKKAVEADRIKNAYLALFREVMREEMEQWFLRLPRLLQGSTQILIEESKSLFALQLNLQKQPSLPIFTENRIKGDDGFPLQILLIETATGTRPTTDLFSSIKLEIVVLDGDFPHDDSKNWSSPEFNRYLVKEREERKPLLTGTTVVTLKDGAAVIDDLKFSDNSKWTRSGNFRIGVRVSSESRHSFNIREAVSCPIVVKDRRGESYMKHYPPLLSDEVWRLENIRKDGVFHKRLVEMNINTVQDFLKLSVIDSALLRKIMQMSKRIWEATINHARTCPLGDKLYIYYGPHFPIALNPICEVQNIWVDGAFKPFQELIISLRAEVQQLASEAYSCWDILQEISITSPGC